MQLNPTRFLSAAFLVLYCLNVAQAQDETEYYDNGMGFMGQKKYAEAEAQFRLSVKTDPRYKEAWEALANVLRLEGKKAQAESVQKIADAAPAARAGTPPALTEDQKRALENSVNTLVTPNDTQKLKTSNNPPALKAPPKLAALKPKAGYIIGRVVTESGAPVPSFTIDYSGFEKGKLANYSFGRLIENVNSNSKGSNGSYQIKVPDGSYRASGYVTYKFKGRTYNFELEPLNPPQKYDYNSLQLDNLRGGLVRDFVLKMTAKKAGASEATETVYTYAYYGGRVDLYADQYEGIIGGGNKFSTPLRNAFPPESRLEITLTPRGPRVDGSTGQPIIGILPLGDDGKYTFSMRGIYPGTYTATARIATPDGQTMPLRLSLKSADTVRNAATGYDKLVVNWQPAVEVDFLPNDVGPAPRMGVKAVKLYLGQ